MDICKKCGHDIIPVGEDYKGNVLWECSNQCHIEESSYRDKLIEDSKTHEQRVAAYDTMMEKCHPDKLYKHKNCWVLGCHTAIERTEETKDGVYGNFCPNPECGKSLRYHRYYGEGKPGDLAFN